jgi:hypothetical protein
MAPERRTAERTPWAAWLAFAAACGVAPAAFWRLSLAEWRALTPAEDRRLARDDLDALMRRFPDEAP